MTEVARAGAPRIFAVVLLAAAMGVASSCKKEAGTQAPGDAKAVEETTPTGGEGAAEPEPGDELETLEAELDRLGGELTTEVTRDKAEPESTEAKSRCQRICDISAAVCDLETRICALADGHAGEDRYVAACTRASSDCERATEACRDCST